MRIERFPGEARRRFPELCLTLLVIAGLVNVAVRFHVDGKLPQPFIFDIGDTFMDWFNTAVWAHNSGAFDVWGTVYPPLSFVFLKVFGIGSCYTTNGFNARDCDYIGRYTIVACFAIGGVLAALTYWREDRRTALFRSISFGFGLPLLFTLERGNLILPCFIFFVFAHGPLGQSHLLRTVSAAITINFKPYLLLPVLAWAFQRRWRELELAGFATIFVYLLTFAALGAGSPLEIIDNTLNWVQFTAGLIWEQVYYTTSYAPFLEFNTHRFPTRDFLPSRMIEGMVLAIPIVIRASQLLAIVTLALAWLQPGVLKTARVSLLMLAASLIAQSPGGYTEVFLIFLLFLERWERPGPIIALIMGYLLSVSYDYVIANFITLSGDSWLGGRSVIAPFGIAIGIFIRPGLIIIMFWALALDSLLLLARAHRVRRPTLALSPALVRA